MNYRRTPLLVMLAPQFWFGLVLFLQFSETRDVRGQTTRSVRRPAMTQTGNAYQTVHRPLHEDEHLQTAIQSNAPGGFWEFPSYRNASSRVPPGVASSHPHGDVVLDDGEFVGEEPSDLDLSDGPWMDGCLPTCCPLFNGRLYGGAEVLGWWTRGMDVPPLVTSSPAGTARDDIGVLGTPGVSVLFGNQGINSDGRVGGRFSLGYWIQPCCLGVEASYVFLNDEHTDFFAASPGTARLARPFRNTDTGAQDAVQLAIPGELNGAISIQATTEFQTFDARLRYNLARQCNMSVDFLLGYRYAELEDQLRISDSITTVVPFPPLAPVIAAGTNLSGFDQFNSINRFHGGQVGFLCQLCRCQWTWEFLMNVAVGNTSSEVFIDGATVITTPAGAPVTQAGSKLALPSNMGRFQQDSLSIMPELGLRLKCNVAQGWQASVGYTLMYWSQVARAGNQIDLDVDPNQFPAPNIPAGTGLWPEFRFLANDFWAQGIGLRLEHQF